MNNIDQVSSDSLQIADRLHSTAIHLLRKLRVSDTEAGVAPAQLSALSVLVFGGAMTLGHLAEIEQVTAPSMSRTIDELERKELVRRARDKRDRRVVYAVATREGKRMLDQARQRRLHTLAQALAQLTNDKRDALSSALDTINTLFDISSSH
jgi:DNA-binding MarR family transcriptional regulator